MITEKINSRIEELREAGAQWIERLRQHEKQAMELYIAQARDLAILAELESLLAEIERLHGPLKDEPADDEPAAVTIHPKLPDSKPAAADQPYRDRDAEIFALLDTGKSMKEISVELQVAYHRVHSARNRWEKKTGKRYFDVCNAYIHGTQYNGPRPAEQEDADDDEADDEPESVVPQSPPRSIHKPIALPPTEPFFDGDDDPLSPTDRALQAKEVETLLKSAGALTTAQIMRARRLGPNQFKQVAAVANIELNDDDKYQLKRRF